MSAKDALPNGGDEMYSAKSRARMALTSTGHSDSSRGPLPCHVPKFLHIQYIAIGPYSLSSGIIITLLGV